MEKAGLQLKCVLVFLGFLRITWSKIKDKNDYYTIAYLFLFVNEKTRELCNELSFGTIPALKTDFEVRLHSTFLEI